MSGAKASRDSQLGSASCAVGDTEEMYWLRQNDDAQSKLALAGALIGQYRYREAAQALESALKLRSGDAAIWSRLGGVRLTLLDFDGSLAAYEQARRCGAEEKTLAFPLAVRAYMLGDFAAAAERFANCLPCDGETAVSVIYWHTLCRLREGREPDLLCRRGTIGSVGHHSAYLKAVSLFAGDVTATGLADELTSANDLDFAIAGYGLYRYLSREGGTDGSSVLLGQILDRESVWPCIASLAAWNDARNARKEDSGNG